MEGPLAGSNFRLTLPSPEPEGKELRSRTSNHRATCLSCWQGAFEGLSPALPKQVSESPFGWRLRVVQAFDTSPKQTSVSSWLVWVSQIQSSPWNFSISSHRFVLSELRGGAGRGEWMRQRMNECLRERRSFREAGWDLLSQNQSSKEVKVVSKS